MRKSGAGLQNLIVNSYCEIIIKLVKFALSLKYGLGALSYNNGIEWRENHDKKTNKDAASHCGFLCAAGGAYDM